MKQESIQVRRITDKVKRYFEIFGFRHYTVSQGNRVSVRGGKRLGGDEVECLISETARGTSVGFYRINTLHGLIFTIPFILLYILSVLSELSILRPYISGSKAIFDIDYKVLFVGSDNNNLQLGLTILIVSGLVFLSDFITQELRIANIKSRFSFFSKDAIWETREVPPSVLSLQTLRSTLTNSYIIGVLYFSVFAFGGETMNAVLSTYRTDAISLRNALTTGYSITGGLLIGIMSGEKGLNLKRINATFDNRSRVSGGILERRIENISFSIQTALLNSVVILLLLSQTLIMSADIGQAILLLIFSIIGAIISAFIFQEDPIWVTSSFAASIFFTTIIFIFRTGAQPGFAFLVFLQLFLIPVPFIFHFSRFHIDLLKENKMNTMESLYDFLPITVLYSIRKENQRKELLKRAYEEQLQEEYVPDKELQSIKLERAFFADKSNPAYLLARHYFELLTSYAASFEENRFILIPSTKQLMEWWEKRSGDRSNDEYKQMLDYVDQLLWDIDVSYDSKTASAHEMVGRKMVLAIQ